MADDKTKMTQDRITPETRPLPAQENTIPARRETPATSPAAKTKPQPKKAPAETVKDTWREIVETVVFVVVLVLLLKSFAAEAFVIPTGSMAETLYGYQKWVKCPKCQFEFPVNCSREVEEESHPPLTQCVCPNCLYQIVFKDEQMDPTCASGDRVLVAKYLGDTHLLDFERFDVVVFKFPEGPQQNYEAKNYIKRLIGLPGDTIGIYRGDLYVARDIPYELVRLVRVSLPDRRIVVMNPTSGLETTLQVDADAQILRNEAPVELQKLEEFNREKELEERDEGVIARDQREGRSLVTRIQVYSNDFPVRRRMYKNFTPAVKLLLEPPPEGVEPRFRIIRKPPAKVLAMRRIVYDNNHPARDLMARKFPPRWAPEKDRPDLNPQDYWEKRKLGENEQAWVAAAGNGFEHRAGSGTETDWLRYRHLLRTTDRPEPTPITDFIGYNEHQEKNWVGDLILDCKIDVKENEGDLILELSKGEDRFQARWELATGFCTLVRHGKNGVDKELKKEPTSLKKPGTFKVRFANVDERLIVWVDNSLPFGQGIDYEPPAHRGDEENHRNNLEPASIGVRGAGVQVSDLVLWRDTYYTNADDDTKTLYVQPGHYLCLGDNSPQSSDSRSWTSTGHRDYAKGGLVPEELMLGRALMVYWPYYRAGTIR